MDSTIPTIKRTTLSTTTPPNYKVFVILGNQWGDEGKGKAMRLYLLEQGSKAKFCIRFNGGPNAGHTVYVRPNDENLFITDKKRKTYEKPIKFATHQVPTGVIFGIPSFVGYNCVVDFVKLVEEINTVAFQLGRDYQELADLITIVPEAHVILPKHVDFDKNNNKVGTTGSGIGPCYSDKALRTGIRVGDYCLNHTFLENTNSSVKKLSELIEDVSPVKSFEINNKRIAGIKTGHCRIVQHLQDNDVVVMEGAQGFHLDPNLGAYPFVTSADCTIAGVVHYGFNKSNIHSIGLSKAYATYVGSQVMEKDFEYGDKYSGDGALLRLFGREYGVTTGRPRQCLPLDLDLDLQSLRVNQTEQWIVSKSDVLVEYDQALKELEKYCKTKDDSNFDEIVKDYFDHTDLDFQKIQKLVENGAFCVKYQGELYKFESWDQMKQYIIGVVSNSNLPDLKQIYWWDSPASEIIVEDE